MVVVDFSDSDRFPNKKPISGTPTEIDAAAGSGSLFDKTTLFTPGDWRGTLDGVFINIHATSSTVASNTGELMLRIFTSLDGSETFFDVPVLIWDTSETTTKKATNGPVWIPIDVKVSEEVATLLSAQLVTDNIGTLSDVYGSLAIKITAA